ncbi:MAG: hypothetical protein HYV07_31295 [Deltaproteobacteria bacterium]|nr:hypothetical protein [Deltaproteobacteria bacterium]
MSIRVREKWPFPVNLGGEIGTTAEEVKALHKGLEKNPYASPLPEVAPVNFLTPIRSSEDLRFGEQDVPLAASDGRTATLTHVVLRRVLSKARRQGAVLFDEAVESKAYQGLPEGRQQQMKTLLSRERAMLEMLDRYNGLAEGVYMRLLATSKG